MVRSRTVHDRTVCTTFVIIFRDCFQDRIFGSRVSHHVLFVKVQPGPRMLPRMPYEHAQGPVPPSRVHGQPFKRQFGHCRSGVTSWRAGQLRGDTSVNTAFAHMQTRQHAYARF